jgi:hypothetical protein
MKRTFLSFFTLLFSFSLVSAADDFDYSTAEQCMENNYVETWGRLKLVGNQLSSEDGEAIQLRGWSSHGYQWTGTFYNDKADFEAMKANGANIFRIAMYVQEQGWQNKEWVQNCIDWTAELGIYCLFDWHILTPGNPLQYLKKQNEDDNVGGKLTDGRSQPVDAEAFFDWVSSYVAEKNYKHVLYEICNEPNGGSGTDATQWNNVKKYASIILPVIAANDPEAIVMVGTASWSQRIDLAYSAPITDNFGLQLMYSFHFYTGTHIGLLPRLKEYAGLVPVFITEWGTTTADGHGTLYLENANKFMDVANGDNDGEVLISWCNWSWSNDNGSGSCMVADNYIESNFSKSGKYIVSMLREGGVPPVIEEGESTPYEGTPQIIGEDEISYIWVEKYDEGGEGVAYFDNNPTWEISVNKTCNAGNFRPDECVDVSKMTASEFKDIDEEEQSKFYNIGYIDNGEWVKYTVDVKKAGFYDVTPFCNAYKSTAANNGISFSIGGKNILRRKSDLSSTITTVRYEPSGEAWDTNNGYNSYDWTYLHKNEDIYGIYFAETGIQTIKVTFTSGSGIGPLKLTYDASASADDVNKEPLNIYPNPTVNGQFNVSFDEAYQAVLDIKTLNGQVAYSTQIYSGVTEINSGLSAGIYIVTVKADNVLKTQKLIIK